MRLALASLALVLLLPAAAQAASPPLEPIPGEHAYWLSNAPQADGRRFVVSNPEPGIVRVLDDETSKTYDVAVPKECYMRGVTVNVALIGCRGPSDAHVLRLDTRELTTIDMPERGRNFEWQDIGRHWLMANWTVNKPAAFYLNRRTGTTVARERFEQPPLDLNLARPTSYSGHHRVWLRDGSFTLKDIFPKGFRTQHLILARRGGPRTLIRRCPRASCGSLSTRTGAALANGLAAWAEYPDRVRAYDSRTGSRYAWRLVEANHDQPLVAGLTRRHVYISMTENHEPRRVKLWRARVR